ncbi:hypothetical protein CROQUDRAFT_658134 [Cronartium quercuum f. sp. fusiforme G11]|uniref:Chromatin modification-related protein n=1 Tax=Cronartium quercuum f. sp. fusiforme G11 TaxID=708437 RepID=A0A9P6NLS4_9BASI|nr:hypothetical protein CROQUDRAFT_658134 [Cronartium quercuum f. sp. fusiforme G11]
MVGSRKKRTVTEEDSESVAAGSPRPNPSSERGVKKPKVDALQRKKKTPDDLGKVVASKNQRTNTTEKNRGASVTKKTNGAVSVESVDEVAEDNELQPTEVTMEESPDIQKEQQAREKLFAEITEEYYDIVEELPLELNRNFTLIGELDANVQECSQEIHEDLDEYLQIAHHINLVSQLTSQLKQSPQTKSGMLSPTHPEREVVATQPLALASVSDPAGDPTAALPATPAQLTPEFVHALWGDIARKMTKVQTLAKNKLNLAETVYEGLDRHLRRIDAELDKYPDLENEDETRENDDKGEQSSKDVLSESCPPVNEAGLEEPIFSEGLSQAPPQKKSTVKRPSKLFKNKIKPSADVSSLLDQSMRSPGPSRTIVQQQAPESMVSLDSEIPTGGYSLRSPQMATLPATLNTPGIPSPRTQTLTNPGVRKPSTIKVTGIFADPSPSPAFQTTAPRIPPSDPNTRSNHSTHLSNSNLQSDPSSSLLAPQTTEDRPTMEMRRSSPILRERRSTSGTVTVEKIPKTPKRTLNGSQRKKVQEEEEDSLKNTSLMGEEVSASQTEDDKLYCYCQVISYGSMVACDNEKCEGGEWFHLPCTDLIELPGESDVEWYCKVCVKKLEGKGAPNRKRKVPKERK